MWELDVHRLDFVSANTEVIWPLDALHPIVFHVAAVCIGVVTAVLGDQ